jgi:hypothetical protein
MFMLAINLTVYAHVELTYPEGGETLYSGDTITITWVQVQAHDVQNWELYFSPDGAETWQVISNNIAAGLREFDWVVPEEETTNGRIRVVQNNTETDYEDVSNNVSILNVTGIEETQNELSVNSLNNYPNPFVNETKIRFTLFEKESVSLEIFQLNGVKVASLVNQLLPQDDYTINWKPKHLQSQTYVAILSVGNKRRGIKIQQSSH